ncbi:hypothetical protein LVJ94_10430 [Pendulispora rubella]|uniref:Uncharacterized protein n=1 Tax=Pendulispora rubella TaxID=2741070 RepID=A0ABZ2LEN2_9BACT
MAWTVTLRYVPEHDFVLTSYDDVILRDQRDATRWRREVSAQFRQIGRIPVDVIIDLRGLVVKPSGARAYGENRVILIKEFCRRTYRFGGDLNTRTSVYTSAVLDGVQANVYATYNDALRALLQEREREAKGELPPSLIPKPGRS